MRENPKINVRWHFGIQLHYTVQSHYQNLRNIIIPWTFPMLHSCSPYHKRCLSFNRMARSVWSLIRHSVIRCEDICGLLIMVRNIVNKLNHLFNTLINDNKIFCKETLYEKENLCPLICISNYFTHSEYGLWMCPDVSIPSKCKKSISFLSDDSFLQFSEFA